MKYTLLMLMFTFIDSRSNMIDQEMYSIDFDTKAACEVAKTEYLNNMKVTKEELVSCSKGSSYRYKGITITRRAVCLAKQ